MRKFRKLVQAPPQIPPTGEGETPGGGETPSSDPTPFGSYGASVFAPPALMLGAFGLHPRTLAHGKSKLGGGALSQFVPLKLGDRRHCPGSERSYISPLRYIALKGECTISGLSKRSFRAQIERNKLN